MIDLYCWPTPNGWKISIALEELGPTLDDGPQLKRWFATVRAREAVQRGLAVGQDLRPRSSGSQATMDDETRKNLFGMPPPATSP